MNSRTHQISPFWRGHLFLFDKPSAVSYSPSAGNRLLLVCLLLELIVRPLFTVYAQRLRILDPDWSTLLQMILLTLVACWLTQSFAGVRLSQIGLFSWRRWSKTEKLYFLQIVPITVIVFSFFTMTDLKRLWLRPHLAKTAALLFVFTMMWGFYQEFVYRGLLQTELIRRWGTNKGIVVSNLAFTFGPLHAYHFSLARNHPSHLWIFAAIFPIGLFFAFIFQRSGNLWTVAIMHGLGDWFIDGLAQISRLGRRIPPL